jgi:hypothetical protein
MSHLLMLASGQLDPPAGNLVLAASDQATSTALWALGLSAIVLLVVFNIRAIGHFLLGQERHIPRLVGFVVLVLFVAAFHTDILNFAHGAFNGARQCTPVAAGAVPTPGC